MTDVKTRQLERGRRAERMPQIWHWNGRGSVCGLVVMSWNLIHIWSRVIKYECEQVRKLQPWNVGNQKIHLYLTWQLYKDKQWCLRNWGLPPRLLRWALKCSTAQKQGLFTEDQMNLICRILLCENAKEDAAQLGHKHRWWKHHMIPLTLHGLYYSLIIFN